MLTFNGQPLTYDANGNLISRQTAQGIITYTWDAQDRLIAISGPNGTASFKYDYQGRRIEKTVNGTTTAFLYDGPQAIAELQGSAIGTTYLTGLRIDEVLARYANQGDRTLLTDALGSILAQTNDAQTATTLYAYSPYGEVSQAGENDNPLQYTGRENDETGLYYYRARFYDPGLKRFLSSDPIGLVGGLNTYTYAGSNPISFIDHDGLSKARPPRPPPRRPGKKAKPPIDSSTNKENESALEKIINLLDKAPKICIPGFVNKCVRTACDDNPMSCPVFPKTFASPVGGRTACPCLESKIEYVCIPTE